MRTLRISVAELLEVLDSGIIRILDASFFLPDAKRDPNAEFAEAHIPHAQRFDIDEIADPASELPHMLPSASLFSTVMSAMGIGSKHDIVVYDTSGLMGAARAWWMFRAFGHERVRILNGGFPAWLAAQAPIEAGPAQSPPPAVFTARLQPERVRSRDDVLAALAAADAQILDARGAARFRGEAPEPRPGLRSGHIPGSRSIPSADLVDAGGLLKNHDALTQLFASRQVDITKPIITTCGSGVTACCVAFALENLGATDVAVYDGSWAEWGADDRLPIERG